MHTLNLILAWAIGVPLVIYFMTRGWTPPQRRARLPRPPREPGPTTGQVIAGFHERIATNAELTRAAAAADQASAVACRQCGRNHFGDCPDDEPGEWSAETRVPGSRVMNARTGELLGYWRPSE